LIFDDSLAATISVGLYAMRAEKGANEIFVTMGVNGEFLHFGGF